MSFQHDSIITDMAFNANEYFAMTAALRSFQVELRKAPTQHPLREEMLGLLADARLRIDRINAKSA
ncbi:hypothetical protein D3Y57_16200 [Sphingomonas paeninsulae]|jgi:hypothetical protein|uniref:Uncharacterized protein n=1 Tax=Sphingomonas paeninsulae TaxID=2319844 RepID=A0A494TD93_SPHPE|nr:hypothetical protein [Sphingomonas paeninsulae]AYJ87190.1 hypothetical protein D3Y57_16200 [Sphingomonas paeninsulae]